MKNDEHLNYQKLIEILGSIRNTILAEGYFDHAAYLTNIIEAINEGNEFYDQINGAELWGGSGAIWEIELNFSDQTKFQKDILDLIEFMRELRILGKRADSVRVLLHKK